MEIAGRSGVSFRMAIIRTAVELIGFVVIGIGVFYAVVITWCLIQIRGGWDD